MNLDVLKEAGYEPEQYEMARLSGFDIRITAPRRADDHSRLVLVELSLGDPDRLGEVLVGQLGIEDFMAELGQVGWFDAARNRLPTVEEKDFHGLI